MDKNSSVIAYLSSIGMFAYLWLNKELILIYILVMIVDSVLMYTASAIHDEVDIDKAKKWLLKKLGMVLIILVVGLWLKALNISDVWNVDKEFVMGVLVLLLIYYEVHSSFNNLHYLRTWEKISQKDYVSKFIKMLYNTVWSFIEHIGDKILEVFGDKWKKR